MMIRIAIVAGLLLATACIALAAPPTLQTFEATIRFADGSFDKVRTQAKDFYEARKAIERTYCGGTRTGSCILEGPWTVH